MNERHIISPKLDADPLRPVVLCGPSGSGKSTLIRKLIQRYPDTFYYCISHTTRPKRSDELNERDYHFVTEEEFGTLARTGSFVEQVIFSGYHYATSQSELDKANQEGRTCLMDVDMRGVQKLQQTLFNPICIFIRPRNFTILERRLRSRSSETEDRIQQRLAVAHQEMQFGIYDGTFDAVIVNDDLDRSLQELVDVLKKMITLGEKP